MHGALNDLIFTCKMVKTLQLSSILSSLYLFPVCCTLDFLFCFVFFWLLHLINQRGGKIQRKTVENS